MSEKTSLKERLAYSKIINKIKKIKHLDIVIVIIFCSVLLLIYFGEFPSKSNITSSQTKTTTFTSYQSYTNDLETRLVNVLKDIKGVGNVSVMITLVSSPELVIAYNTQEKKSSTNESVTIIKEPIVINANGTSYPLVLTEILPQVKGVIIVAQGAETVSVKLDILTATMKILGVSANSVEIFAGE